jgi:hypothetical protein
MWAQLKQHSPHLLMMTILSLFVVIPAKMSRILFIYLYIIMALIVY